MFWQMITIEHTKLFKRAILWIEVAFLAVGIIALYALLYATSLVGGASGEAAAQLREVLTWPGGLENAVSFASGPNLGGLMLIILAGAVTAQEYTWRTMQLWLSRGVSRPMLLGSKFAALLLPAVLLVLTTLVAGGAASALFSRLLDGSIPFGEVSCGRLAVDAAKTAYTLLPYAALAFCLAIVSRSTVVAVGGGLAYSLLLEGIVAQLLAFAGGSWGKIGTYLPAGLAHSLMESRAGLTVEVNGTSAQGAAFVSPEAAVAGIALYVLIFLGLATLAFRRQDLGG